MWIRGPEEVKGMPKKEEKKEASNTWADMKKTLGLIPSKMSYNVMSRYASIGLTEADSVGLAEAFINMSK